MKLIHILIIIFISNLFSFNSFAECNFGLNLGDSYPQSFKDKYGKLNLEDTFNTYREKADKICASTIFGDIEIEFTGLRQGEKLYEELLIGDNVKRTIHKHIMSAVEEKLSYNEVLSYIEKFKIIGSSTSSSEIKKLLQESIGSSFIPKDNVVDIQNK